MRRTSLSLPDDLAVALEREARRRGTTVSAVARDALASHLGLGQDGPRPLGFAALGRSTGRDMEDLLRRDRQVMRE